MTPKDMRDYWFEMKIRELQRMFAPVVAQSETTKREMEMLDEFHRILAAHFDSFKPQG